LTAKGSALLDQLTTRPAWQADAACLDVRGADQFFSEAPAKQAAALAVCQGCPVTDACLAYAIETDSEGVWGGTTSAARRQPTTRPDNQCSKGHELTEDNIRWQGGGRWRTCRTCERVNQQQRAAARRAGRGRA
jgi:WhiB family transcriptional regulator, redox-sensing transcriptional regulator